MLVFRRPPVNPCLYMALPVDLAIEYASLNNRLRQSHMFPKTL